MFCLQQKTVPTLFSHPCAIIEHDSGSSLYTFSVHLCRELLEAHKGYETRIETAQGIVSA